MKTQQKPIFIFITLSFFFSININAQGGQLIGVVDNNLVEINPQNGSLTQLVAVNAPLGTNIVKLAYSISDCIFYGLINTSSNPSLISIDWNGNYTVIGALTITGGTVFSCEAISFNAIDNKLYGGASLNGGTANNDFFSEAIVEINPVSAVVTTVSVLMPGSTTQTDIDGMDFIGNTLYIHDGAPGFPYTSVFYELNFQGIGPTANPTQIFSTNYQPIRDLASISNQLFWTTSDLGFYELDTDNINYSYIGQTHTFPTYNGVPIGGLDYVEIEELPILNVDTTICLGQELSLNINLNNAIVTWNTGMVGNSISINTEGVYWANIQLGNCMYISDTAIVAIEKIAVDLGPDLSICEGEFEVLNAFQEGATYLWQDGSAGPVFIAAQKGWYTVEVTIGGCSDVDSLYLEVIPIPDVNFGTDTTLCYGDSLVLSVAPPVTSTEWSDGSTSNVLTISSPGTYWVNAMNGFCGISDTITVHFDEPVADLGPDLSICEGDSTILSSLQNGATYLWQDGSTNPSLTASSQGWYSIQVNIGSCFAVDSLFLTVSPYPAIDLGSDTTICPNTTLMLDAFYAGATYLWNDGSVNPFLQIDEPGVYSVEVSLNDCVSTQEIAVEILPAISEINIGTDSILCLGFELELNINTEYADEYLWSNGEQGNSIIITESGNYFVLATNECESVTSNIIHLTFEDCNCYFWLPNSFSPNIDGINDFFAPFSDCEILQYEFRIFDRWGDFVFESNDFSIGWDGIFRGQNASVGVYAYFIKSIVFRNGAEEEIRLEGDVTLIR